MEYARTKDILNVMKMLGHRNIARAESENNNVQNICKKDIIVINKKKDSKDYKHRFSWNHF